MFAETASVPLSDPEAGDTLNQAPLVTLAFQFSVPPPELETVTDWFAGFAAPAVALNVSEVGFNPMAGGAGADEIVSDTPMV